MGNPSKPALMRCRARLLCAVVVALVGNAPAAVWATTIASDNAGNYGAGWTSGSNGGTGFGPWTFVSSGGSGGAAGAFVGNPQAAGVTNFGTSAFGLYANPSGTNAFVNADRSLGQPLGVGDTLSFQYAVNFDSSGGNKGFDLYTGGTGGTQLINVNQGGFPGNITINGANTGFAYGTNPMTWSFQMTNATTLSVTATPRDGVGSNYVGTFTVPGPPNALRFYASNLPAGDNPQPYFNNLSVVSVPEPSTMVSLAAFGLTAAALASGRRRWWPVTRG